MYSTDFGSLISYGEMILYVPVHQERLLYVWLLSDLTTADYILFSLVLNLIATGCFKMGHDSGLDLVLADLTV